MTQDLKKLPNYDLNLLKHFLCLIRADSVTSASNLANISQPAMSLSLKKLRKVFNDELFITSKSGIKATNTSITLHPMIRKIFNEIEDLQAFETSFNPTTQAEEFVIYCSELFEIAWGSHILKLLRRFNKSHSLRINSLKDLKSNSVLLDSEQPIYDLIIAGTKLPIPNVKQRKLIEYQYVIVSNKSLKIKEEKTYLKWSVMNNNGKTELDSHFKEKKLRRKTMSCNSIASLLELIEHNCQLVAILPKPIEKLVKRYKNLKMERDIDSKLTLSFYCHWSLVDDKVEKNRWFRKLISDNIKN